MKRLLLLRHAKSSWDEPGLKDHDRPLAPRGRRGAKAIAAYMTENELAPTLVLCSSAVRARQTLELLAPALPEDATVEIEPEIYGAGTGDLTERLRRVPRDQTSVLLIGHNPTLQELVLSLAAEGARLESVREKFPTAALAALDFEIEHWAELRPGTARLTDYVTPRQLVN